MIGAGVLLYSITGDRTYLERARHTARVALDYYGGSEFAGQPPAFNAIFFRNLLHLASVDQTLLAATQDALARYAEDAWAALPHRRGADPFRQTRGLRSSRPGRGIIQIFACQAWDVARYDLLCVALPSLSPSD